MTDTVTLDLTDPSRYPILVGALDQYASEMEHQAQEADDDIQERYWLKQAAIARQLREDIEEQLDAHHVDQAAQGSADSE